MAEEEPFDADAYYPSLDLAYDVSLLTYDWAIRRLQAVERRIDNLLALGLTGTVTLPVIARLTVREATSITDFATPPGIAALLFFLAALFMGVVARQIGHVSLINPQRLYKFYIRKQPWEFQRNIIHYAGEAHAKNAELIQTKSAYANWVAAFFGFEGLLGAIWILTL